MVEATETPIETVPSGDEDFDLVVVGESEPTLASTISGDVHECLDDRAIKPMIVVRRAVHDEFPGIGPAGSSPEGEGPDGANGEPVGGGTGG